MTHIYPDGKNYSGIHTEEEWQAYLKKVEHFSPGQFVCYNWHVPNSATMTEASVKVILFRMPRSEMTWKKGMAFPEPFILLTPGKYDRPEYAYCSYESLTDMRYISTEEYDRFVKDNVQLPDYIQQVKDAIKAGSCVVN
jgi:hypothetical protein